MRRRTAVALAVVALVAAWGLRVATVRVPRATNATPAVHGAYHVHSEFSDGHGSVDQIAQDAAALGLDFVVMSDHNVLIPAAGGVKHGVQVVMAVEESTRHGHVVSLGAGRQLTKEEAWDADSALPAIRAVGGTPMIAHPYNRKMPFTDWKDIDLAGGMEVLSDDDLWREALHAPLARGLLLAALEAPFNRRLAVAELIRRPANELLAYDGMRRTHDLALLCSVDAHGIPDYPSVLGSMSMYLDIPKKSAPPQHAEILAALEQGHAYCGVDAIAPAGGFAFTADAHHVDVQVPTTAPLFDVQVHVFRDGIEVESTAERHLELRNAEPGDYRVEVWARLPGVLGDGPWVPWILSNPIRLK